MITLVPATALPRVLTAVDLKKIGTATARVLKATGRIEVGVRFVSLKEMQTLNKTFRGKNRPTDVLSFEARVEEIEGSKELYWGDLAICTDYAKEEAKRRGLSTREELARLLIHGILHLAGYDHATTEEELEMFAIQERVLETIL